MGNKRKNNNKHRQNNRQEKQKRQDAIINHMLFVTVFCIIASIIVWLIFKGYTHTATILMMGPIVTGLFAVSAVVAGLIGLKIGRSRKKVSRRWITAFTISIVIMFSSLAIKDYLLYAMYALWILIAIYLVVSFVYYIYKLNQN